MNHNERGSLFGYYVAGLGLLLWMLAASHAAGQVNSEGARPARILWYSEAQGRAVTLGVEVGYCVGERSVPTIKSVRVVERRKAGSPSSGRAIITAYATRPTGVPGTVEGERGPEAVTLCEGVAREVNCRIRLKRPVSHVELFDGSSDPPHAIGRRE